MRRAVIVLIVAVVAVVGACGDDDDGSSSVPPSAADVEADLPAAAAPGTYQVAELTETYVDDSRPTEPPDGQGRAPSRTLVTTIVYPQGEGPFPLIVLAHGLTGNPDKFTELTTAWASAGFIVAAPLLPLTSNQVPMQVIADYNNQPGDLSFVIDEVLARSEGDEGPLAGLVTADHVGVAGLSLGGATVYGIGFNSCCRDDRVDAALVMAGMLFDFEGEFEWPAVPLMVIAGNADNSGRDPYSMASPPKYLWTFERALHSAPFEDADDPGDELVVTVTVDFWNGYLHEDDGALERLLTDAMVPGTATLEHEA
ncbi:MAG: alpha/beta hydrolase family protein [Actinomycetota bacterium]